MNQEQFLQSDISRISAGRRVSKGKQVFYKSRKKNPPSRINEENANSDR
jgi:hypothetical protein